IFRYLPMRFDHVLIARGSKSHSCMSKTNCFVSASRLSFDDLAEAKVKIQSFRLLIAALVGFFALHAGGLARAERLTVRLDFIPVGFHAAMHLAKEKGWFAREGLEVEIQDGTGSLN